MTVISLIHLGEIHMVDWIIEVLHCYILICMNAWPKKKKDQLTKRGKVTLRKERNHLQMCEQCKKFEYKESEKRKFDKKINGLKDKQS